MSFSIIINNTLFINLNGTTVSNHDKCMAKSLIIIETKIRKLNVIINMKVSKIFINKAASLMLAIDHVFRVSNDKINTLHIFF